MSKTKKHIKDKKQKEEPPPARPRPSTSSGRGRREPVERRPRTEPLLRALEWPGACGWVGTIFGLAGTWSVVSALLLGSLAARIEDASPDARAVAESSRPLGFGEWFLKPVLLPTKAGVSVRDGLGAEAKSVTLYFERERSLSPMGRLRMASRGGAGRFQSKDSPEVRPPYRLKLVRRGDVVEGYRLAADGSWQSVDKRTVRMGERVLVGLCAWSPVGEGCTARFRDVEVAPAPEGGAPPEWYEADAGGVGGAGPAGFSGRSITVTGGVGSIGGRADSYRFVYREIVGDFEIAARLAALDPELVLPDPLREFLFSVDPALIADLENGGLEDDFLREFRTHRVPLSRSTTVTPEEEGSRWRITDAPRRQVYTAERTDKSLDIYRSTDIARAGVAVTRNARASGVFGTFALALCAFLWGLRLFEPSFRAQKADEKPDRKPA